MSSNELRPPTSRVAVDRLYGSEKIVTLEFLAPMVAQARANGLCVVFTNGCFDLLHVGHVDCLVEAKELGDLLVVGINSDASTRRLKGPQRPIVPERERCELVAALAVVDYVVLFDEDQPIELLKRLRPDIHAKGTDYTAETVPERDVVHGYGGRIAITGGKKRPGSRGIVATILERYGDRPR